MLLNSFSSFASGGSLTEGGATLEELRKVKYKKIVKNNITINSSTTNPSSVPLTSLFSITGSGVLNTLYVELYDAIDNVTGTGDTIKCFKIAVDGDNICLYYKHDGFKFTTRFYIYPWDVARSLDYGSASGTDVFVLLSDAYNIPENNVFSDATVTGYSESIYLFTLNSIKFNTKLEVMVGESTTTFDMSNAMNHGLSATMKINYILD